MKIVTVIGARPQFIKAAVVSRAIAAHKDIKEVIVHTGQHFDANMSDIFFEEMCIPKPDYNLNINGLGHGAMTGQMLEKIETVLLQEKPDWVLVYGDTNSTIAGALAAKKLHIKVAHVEAGLRSFNMDMPEEINRILTDRISDILFCPTETAVNNLKKEGYENINCRIIRNGDVMQDAALFYAGRAVRPKTDIPEDFVLCTVHRAENTDDPERLRNIFSALEEISKTCRVVLPLHPRTKGKLSAIGYDTNNSHILFIEPVGYLEMVWMLKHCRLVMTDSGGLQKEAYFFDKYCITLRDETEWVELVKYGYNFLAGDDKGKIISLYNHISDKNNIEQKTPLYGNGNAGDLIVETLRNY
ncbi:MAG TPA: UDP-N-acetylglucosamine 2-epimerase (non-hydrolyzing) [Candidatus Coprenecus stercoravium]|uniref:UDP-N-acetylglucosamine 2-epimerase (Non-hydrolyzing) n=1 Tax=Candidatus Coprenecus stercoravium TaxID=2840735 RepID=A0A9D2GPL2_9BACT|nr:UDP-N-acetylglucosamine 2-epimerase (non-hydrolyzing) [Candidatus Coprenecus stercoravium]